MSTGHTIRTTDNEAVELAHGLVRASPFATLASLSGDGFPLATLTSVATDVDGSPVILVSRLSGHTTNLLGDPRCSLLFARTGKGDPLAHPRISLMGTAVIVDRDSEAGTRIKQRFLARQPKAQLYVDFPDFLFIRIAIRSASLNGGFGKAYELTEIDLASDISDATDLVAAEADILAHMNSDHAEAVRLYATRLGKRDEAVWRMVSLDPDGFEVAAHGELVRIAFGARLTSAEAAHAELIRLVKLARER
ncbi:MAG: HugZ family protein [Bosea sp. (in: a-proteobacteria)]